MTPDDAQVPDPGPPVPVPADPVLTQVAATIDTRDKTWVVRALLDGPHRGEFAALFRFATDGEALAFVNDRPAVEAAALAMLAEHDRPLEFPPGWTEIGTTDTGARLFIAEGGTPTPAP